MSRVAALLYHLCRLLLGGLFLYAGAVKADDVVAFARDVANYKILPYSWNYLVAATLPYVEVVAGLLLVANRKVRPAALVIGVLTAVFMLALASVELRGMDIDCGCFDPVGEGHTSARAALLRDLGIMILVVLTYRLRGRMPDPRR
jgi:uncharacterized membrane protein YphA (DoxX/SURF4 family)